MVRKCYIGNSRNPQIRYKATSGGIGTTIVKYLLEEKIVDYALSFYFDKKKKLYYPKLIDNFEDYVITGSIYQEYDMKPFFRKVLSEKNANKKFVLFALPCQTPFIRTLAKRNHIQVLIVGLTCSSQQTNEATDYLFNRLNINRQEIERYQYRGNGWPSGIQIHTVDGREYNVPNNNSIWSSIFHSRLFIPSRCFKCQDTLNRFCDIVLADPWLPEYVNNEDKGKSLFAAYTETGLKIIEELLVKEEIETEEISYDKLLLSQSSTINRKKKYKQNPRTRNLLMSLIYNKLYRKIIFSSNYAYKLHDLIKKRLEYNMKN